MPVLSLIRLGSGGAAGSTIFEACACIHTIRCGKRAADELHQELALTISSGCIANAQNDFEQRRRSEVSKATRRE
eukprot:1046281-Pleurochrysis_carterae.AAC.1